MSLAAEGLGSAGVVDAAIVVPRRLRRTNAKTGIVETIEQAELLALKAPVVILGDPGLGKSVLTSAIGSEGANIYVRAGTFVRSKVPAAFLPEAGGKIVIDGLDEVASNAIGGGVDEVLGQLSALGNPAFILSSREADWRGAAARVQIEDDYVIEVVVLHLEPFTEEDAKVFLAVAYPQLDASALLERLEAHCLQEMYRNPLTLRLVGRGRPSGGPAPRDARRAAGGRLHADAY